MGHLQHRRSVGRHCPIDQCELLPVQTAVEHTPRLLRCSLWDWMAQERYEQRMRVLLDLGSQVEGQAEERTWTSWRLVVHFLRGELVWVFESAPYVCLGGYLVFLVPTELLLIAYLRYL